MKNRAVLHLSPAGGRRSETAAVVALWAAAALHAGVLAQSAFLPFVDLPQHVAAAQLVAHRHRPEIAALYDFDLVPQVNVLGLLVLAPLVRLLPEAAAVRVLLGLDVALLALALRFLARRLETSAWSAVAALLFALHFDLAYGFLSFSLGIPVLLVLLGRAATARPASGARLLQEALLWVLLALSHVLLLGFGVAAWLLVAGRLRRAAVRREAAALVPAAALCGVWLGRAAAGGAMPRPALAWDGAGAKLRELGRALLVASRPGTLEWIVLVAVACVAAWLWWRGRRLPVAAPVARARAAVRLSALLAAVAYAVLPYAVHDADAVTQGLFVLYQRFLVLAPLLLLPALPWPAGPRQRAGLAAAVCGLHLLLATSWSAALRRTAAEARGLDAAIAAMPPGARLKSLIYTMYPSRWRYEAFLHAASYYQARRLGEVDQSFALLPLAPVHYRDPRRPYLSRHDEHMVPESFDWRQAARWDFVLIYDRDGASLPAYARWADAPVLQGNGWILVDTRRMPAGVRSE